MIVMAMLRHFIMLYLSTSTVVHSPVAGLTATPAPRPTPPHSLILQMDVSRTWNMVCAHKICVTETVGCFSDRFREDLRSTRLPDSDLPAGCYFASLGHSPQDMLVSVLLSSFRDATGRCSFKARMIFKLCTLHPKVSMWTFVLYKTARAVNVAFFLFLFEHYIAHASKHLVYIFIISLR